MLYALGDDRRFALALDRGETPGFVGGPGWGRQRSSMSGCFGFGAGLTGAGGGNTGGGGLTTGGGGALTGGGFTSAGGGSLFTSTGFGAGVGAVAERCRNQGFPTEGR